MNCRDCLHFKACYEMAGIVSTEVLQQAEIFVARARKKRNE